MSIKISNLKKWLHSHDPVQLSLLSVWVIAFTPVIVITSWRIPLGLVSALAVAVGGAIAWLLRPEQSGVVNPDFQAEPTVEASPIELDNSQPDVGQVLIGEECFDNQPEVPESWDIPSDDDPGLQNHHTVDFGEQESNSSFALATEN